jgi:hypothetical protein
MNTDIFNATEPTLDENIYMFVYTLSKINVKDKERFWKHSVSKCVFHYWSYSMEHLIHGLNSFQKNSNFKKDYIMSEKTNAIFKFLFNSTCINEVWRTY